MCDEELPYLTEGYLGPQAKFEPYGLTTISHPDPVIPLNTNKVLIVIGVKEKTKFTTKFKRMEPIKEMNNCVLTQNREDEKNEMHYYIAVSQPGFYKFEIYALPGSEAGPHFIGVYNYLIHVKNVDTYVEPFPKQYPVWKREGCFLYEPMMLQKGVNFPVKFKYLIPRAMDVMVKVGDDWFKMDKAGTTKTGTIYETVVDFSTGYPPGTKVRLNVKFSPGKFDILMEYTI